MTLLDDGRVILVSGKDISIEVEGEFKFVEQLTLPATSNAGDIVKAQVCFVPKHYKGTFGSIPHPPLICHDFWIAATRRWSKPLK